MIADGADIVDVGGESTRPGSLPVSAAEEMERVVPVIAAVRARWDVPVSVDAGKHIVAEEAAGAGADLINDISGLRFDPGLASVAARRELPMVLMHSRDVPRTMQAEPRYGDLRAEIIAELGESVRVAIAAGVRRDRIIVDPGIGFGKTVRHNLEILGTHGFLDPLGLPVLIGPSNKSFIGAVDGDPSQDRTGGTAAAVAAAVMAGADFVRVHDVRTMLQASRVAHAMRLASSPGGPG